MTLEDIVATIAAEMHPQQIILFGSHARGDATPDSDYDLFVIVPYDGDRHELGARARASVRKSISSKGWPVTSTYSRTATSVESLRKHMPRPHAFGKALNSC